MSDRDKLSLREDDSLIAAMLELGIDPHTLDDVDDAWETPEDLSRLSIEAMVRKQLGTSRALKSTGFLRLYGAGVTDHTAHLDAVGGVMVVFQNLVTAIGAFIEGHGASLGKIPQSVIHGTQLELAAQPAPGSIILTITPKADELSTAHPEGPTLWGYESPKIVLADESMGQLIDFLGSISLVDIEPFIEKVKAAGPRQAGKLKTLLKLLADNGFDVDVAWEEPGKPTRRVSLTSDAANFAYINMETRDTDTYEEDIVGTIHTVSEAKMLEITPDDTDEFGQGIIHIRKGDLTTAELANYGITQRVRVHVRTTQQVTPGALEPKLIREALSIERVVD